MPALRRFFDIPFSAGSIDDIVGLVASAARGGGATVLVTPNVHHIVAIERQLPEAVRSTYLAADYFLCDSKIVARLAQWRGLDLTPRTGTDRVADLLASPASRDLTFALAGPTRAQTEAMRACYPDRRFLHIETPAALARGTPEWSACVADASAAPWDVLLSCLSFPKQELFAADVRDARRDRGGVIMCVGAAVDFLSGALKRAPEGFQRFGLEWLHRLLSDPRRLWRRYLLDGPTIFLLYRERVRRGEI